MSRRKSFGFVAAGTKAALACVAALAAAAAWAGNKVSSPDGRVSVDVEVGSALKWSVERNGVRVLLPSKLGLEFRSQAPFGKMEVVKEVRTAIDETWTNRLYKKETIRDHANELKLELQETEGQKRRLDLYFRAYDGAVAFRYGIPKQKGFEVFTVMKECTEWRFAQDPLAWLTQYDTHRTSQEEAFYHRSLGSMDSEKLIGMPAIVETEGQMVALCEADLTDWAGLCFRKAKDQNSWSTALEADLAPIPGGHGALVIGYAPKVSPWRVMILGDDELDLLANNDVILNLNPPPEGGDEAFDWVKPGASSWDWWYESNNTLSTDLTLRLIDLAAEMGWEYHTIDGGWYGLARSPNWGPGVKIEPNPKFDLDRILAYAKAKGVGIWVWCYWSALEENGVDKVFADFRRRGIKGVKIDFMDRQDQWMVRWYEKVIRSAAKHQLMINYHGAYKPTGMNRTWPNQITREGIRGNEMTKFTATVTPMHCATLPFTRFLLGPGDFTPGSFGNVLGCDFVTQSRRGHRYGDATDDRLIGAEEIGTRAHALSLCVAYDSPLTTLCDWPERYRGAKGVEALRKLPTVWKNTKPISGKIGDHYCVAREAYDGRFYLALVGNRKKTYEVALDFLSADGEWEAQMYLDGPDAAKNAKDITVTTRKVDSKTKLSIPVAEEGGALIVFGKCR